MIEHSGTRFAPWEKDYKWAAGIATIGLLTAWIAAFSAHQYIAAAISLVLARTAQIRLSRGLTREKGIFVERAAIRGLRGSLTAKEYGVDSDVAAAGLGNIDCVVIPPWSPASYVIEIKAYAGIIRRPYGLTKLGKYSSLAANVRQVKAQCRYLYSNSNSSPHHPVLWAPISICNNWFVYGDILVVNGGVSTLEQALWAYGCTHRYFANVVFASKPPKKLRSYLMDHGFRYSGHEAGWYGLISPGELEVLRDMISPANGTARFFQRRTD